MEGNPAFDKFGNSLLYDDPHVSVYDQAREAAKKRPGKAVIWRTTQMPGPKERGLFTFRNYYPEQGVFEFAIPNGSPLPMGPTHVIGGRIAVTNDKHFLLVRDKYGPSAYWFPGGTVMPFDGNENPTPPQIALQELVEEVGLDYRSHGKEHTLMAQVYLTKPDIAHFYHLPVATRSTEFVLDEAEITDARWVSLAEAENNPTLVTEITLAIMRHIMTPGAPPAVVETAKGSLWLIRNE